jgi:hypothetical protein
MVSVGAADHILRGAQYPGHVVNRYAELQEHRRASVSEDVRGNLGTEARQFPRGPPSPPLLGLDGAPGILDGKSRCEPTPTTEVGR